jgi:hypothetical protein
LIEPFDKIWDKLFVFNEFNIEHKTIAKKIPLIIIRDIFKYPDELYDLISKLSHWSLSKGTPDSSRPGISYIFSPIIMEYASSKFNEKISKVFGVKKINTTCMYSTICYSEMPLDPRGLSCIPHFDAQLPFVGKECHQVVTNFNLSKTVDPVVTGFWSWMGKCCCLDHTVDERQYFNQYVKKQSLKTKWVQIKDDEDFKFEGSIEMPYNSAVIYPTTYLHNPYIEEGWFCDSQRLMLSIFSSISSKNLSYPMDQKNHIKNIWERFRLSTYTGYYF